MKRLLVCALILVGVVTVGLSAYHTTEKGAVEMLAILDILEEQAASGDFEGASASAEEALAKWQQYTAYAHLYIEQNLMGHMTVALARLRVYASVGGDSLAAECSSIRLMLEDLRESQRLSLGNVL